MELGTVFVGPDWYVCFIFIHQVFFVSAKMLKAEIQWYRGPYSTSSSSPPASASTAPPPAASPLDLTPSRVSAMTALLNLEPDSNLNTAMVLLGRLVAASFETQFLAPK